MFTLEGADQPYRVLVETMSEGAATLSPDSTVLYCNSRLAHLLGVPLERILGKPLLSHVAPGGRLGVHGTAGAGIRRNLPTGRELSDRSSVF